MEMQMLMWELDSKQSDDAAYETDPYNPCKMVCNIVSDFELANYISDMHVKRFETECEDDGQKRVGGVNEAVQRQHCAARTWAERASVTSQGIAKASRPRCRGALRCPTAVPARRTRGTRG